MLLGMALMFLLMIAAQGALAWLLWRRIAAYLQGNEEAVAALTKHLFMPLLGRKQEAKPEVKKVKATLV